MRPAPCALVLVVLLAVAGPSRARVQTSLPDLTNSIDSILPSLSRPANSSRIFYGVMFDAGSTGTRIHVYTFIQRAPGSVAGEPRTTVLSYSQNTLFW